MKNNTYTPIEFVGNRNVVCNSGSDLKNLDKCLDIVNHSPNGFNWGYGGSGPAQLALAIMVNEYGRDLDEHPVHYQAFKWKVIANLPKDSTEWKLTSKDIQDAIDKIKAE